MILLFLGNGGYGTLVWVVVAEMLPPRVRAVTNSVNICASFILGFVTLTAASLYSLAKDGGDLVDQFGLLNPLIGLVFAFVAAVVAIKWMIRYLETNSLAIFGWYRIGIGAVAVFLIVTGQI